MLQVHSEERRGLDRRIKDLEIRLSGALSSKSLSDEEHAQRAQVCPAASHARWLVCRPQIHHESRQGHTAVARGRDNRSRACECCAGLGC